MTEPVHSYKPQLAVTDDLKALVLSLEARVGQLEGGKPAAKPAPAKPAPAKPAPADEEDDDVDLFGSSDEEESEEKKRITEERLKAYHEKKAKKPQVIAKTSVLLDVKVSFYKYCKEKAQWTQGLSVFT